MIADNGDYGIFLEQGQQDQFTQNSTFANPKAGIFVNYAMNRVHRSTHAGIHTRDGQHRYTIGHFGREERRTRRTWSRSTPVPRPQSPDSHRGRRFVKEVTVQTDGTGQGTFSLTEPDSILHSHGHRPEWRYLGVVERCTNRDYPAGHGDNGLCLGESVDSGGQQVTFTAVVAASRVRSASRQGR